MKAVLIAAALALAPGAASAAGFYLLLDTDKTYAPLILIPKPYATRSACSAAGEVYKKANPPYRAYQCIPAP